MSFLTVSDISFAEHGHAVLQNISFTQRQGQKIALAGETGAGKSTLLQLLAGLVQPGSGQVSFDGRRVRGPVEVLVPGHPGIVYLSQQSDLPQFLRVEQVLRYANKQPAAEAQQVYDICRISHLAQRRTDQVSGGERQRIALARLLLSAPKLLLLDEPFSNLDRVHKQLLQTVIREVGERLGITCLLISHDPADTLSWADEIIVLQAGRIVQQAPPEQLYRQPVNEYAAGLFGDYNLLSGPDKQALVQKSSVSSPAATLLVRPEQFILNPPRKTGLAGTVQSVRFFGGYYELTVQLPTTTVRVRATTSSLTPGDAVRLAVAPPDAWFIE